MKYLPLVWAAIMRKPTRAILTFLSVMVAFTLFGLTIGMNATFDKMQEQARADRIWSWARFATGNSTLPVALARQIEALPGVSGVGTAAALGGYHADPKNRAFAWMMDDKVRTVMTDWPITAQQWDLLKNNRQGLIISKIAAERWKLKPGDSFTMIAPRTKKADGSTSWVFHILSVADDISYFTDGFMMGNYDYLDKARPLAQQGKAGQFFIQSGNPDRAAEVAQKIDATFANSAVPLQSTTEKAALDVAANTGIDIAAADREIALAGMFMVLFLTANSIAQAVRERFAEFATLKTVGFTDTGVILLVFAEAALPCLIGAVLGVGLAALVSSLIPKLMSGNGIPIPTVSAMVVFWAMLAAALVALVSSALPALRLKQMDIATALSGRT
ncbi:MAG TPA: FtsX-like permease family protein [Rhizomicrobium sp.]|nr:FtsX-like permease family protein [Rhizomicrobium sp.]